MLSHSGRSRSTIDTRAFTLVELSIVLVILGLLVGGTLAGRSLIRNAELRNILDEKEQYVSAITQFQSRFQYLPGDFARAGDYFGLSADCGGTSSLATATCNGNGNGSIEMELSYLAIGAPFNEELFFAWAHLFAAGLVNIDYSGQQGLAENDAIGGVNVPNSKVDPGTWLIANLYGPSGGVFYFDGNYQHTLFLGAESNTNPTAFNYDGVITPLEAYSIDSKSDDGMPATGTIRTFTGAINPNCTIKADLSGASADADLDAVYRIGGNDPNNDSETVACALLFPNAVK